MSLVTRTVEASTNAHSRRCASATARLTSPGVSSWPARSAGQPRTPAVPANGLGSAGHVEDRPDLDAAEERRAELGYLERVIEIARLDDVVTAQHLLGLGEGAVGHDVAPDAGRGRRRVKPLAADHGPAELADLPVKPHVRFHHLLFPGGVHGRVGGFLLVNQDHVLRHLSSLVDGCTHPTNVP